MFAEFQGTYNNHPHADARLAMFVALSAFYFWDDYGGNGLGDVSLDFHIRKFWLEMMFMIIRQLYPLFVCASFQQYLCATHFIRSLDRLADNFKLVKEVLPFDITGKQAF